MSLFTTLRTDRDARVSEVAEIIAELKDPIKVEHEECGSDATDLIQETPGAAKCVRSTSSVRKTPQQMLELDEENRKKQVRCCTRKFLTCPELPVSSAGFG